MLFNVNFWSALPKGIAPVFGVLVPVFIAIIAVRIVVSTNNSSRTAVIVEMIAGIVGTLIGYQISHQFYWQAHGLDLPWLYTIPGALLGGLSFVGITRVGRFMFLSKPTRTNPQSSD